MADDLQGITPIEPDATPGITGQAGGNTTGRSEPAASPAHKTSRTRYSTPASLEGLEDYVDQAHIVEETVVAVPKSPERTPVPDEQQAPSVSPPQVTPPTTGNEPAIDTRSPVPQTPFSRTTPGPLQNTQPEDKKVPTPEPAPQKREDATLAPQSNVSEPRPTPQPVPPTEKTEMSASIEKHEEPKEDIENILKEIKLPERTSLPEASETKESKRVYDTSLTSTATERPHTAPSPTKAAGQAAPKARIIDSESSTSIVTPLRTLKDDFQHLIRDRKLSLVRAAALEQDKRRAPDSMSARNVQTKKTHRTFGIVFAIIIFTALGSAAFLGVALVVRDRSDVASTLPQTSLLFSEAALPLPLENLTAFDVKDILAQARIETSVALGSITRIVPVVRVEAETPGSPNAERQATLEEFFMALGIRVSPDLIRALDPEFFFGIHTVDENAPLFVIPVASYERAFAGMLEWEDAMNADLTPAFTRVPDTMIGADGLVVKRQFEDVVMRNYDVRALKDEAGVIQLYYSFPTRNVLIIAESPHSFAEVLSRLRAERKL